MTTNLKSRLLLAAFGMVLVSEAAQAGGFALREQSTSSQGAAFAGNAAGGDLSSMFWNPAALAASHGMNMESHAALFLGESVLTGDGGILNAVTPPAISRSSGDIAQEAIIPSSYFGMQVSPDFWVGLATNSPFGLVTKPEDRDWVGAPIARKSKIFTLNANPNVAYQVMPGVAIGAGIQVQYMEGELKFGQPGAPSVFFNGDDIAFGVTAGIYLTPAEGTQIGIGYRSQITHDLDGTFGIVGIAGQRAGVELTTPDVITVSLRQEVRPGFRVMGTFEWTNWSEFDVLTVDNTTLIGQPTASIVANWHDAWFASIGAEMDVSDVLTVRAGIAYEESPIQDPTERLTPVPDADRLWVSVGGTYQFNSHTTLDFAYTHVFVDEARFDREPATAPGINLTGSVDTDVNLFSVSMKTKLDADHPIFGAFFH